MNMTDDLVIPSSSNMSKIIPSIADYRDLFDFLAKHFSKKKGDPNSIITNTRIGDKNTSISGGSYNIPDAEYPIFLQLYYQHVLKKNGKEYLTEKQREGDGPILIDLDLRHTYETDERQYTKEHIDDLIDTYLEILKEIYQMDGTTAFKVYVMEKATVNRVKDKNYLIHHSIL